MCLKYEDIPSMVIEDIHIKPILDIQGAYPKVKIHFFKFTDENTLKEALYSLIQFLHSKNLTNLESEHEHSTENQTEDYETKTRFEHVLKIFKTFFIALTENEESFTKNPKNKYSFFQSPTPGVMNTCLLFAQIAYISEALINDVPFNSGSFNFAYNKIVRAHDFASGLTLIATTEWREWQHRILFILGIYDHINPYIENLSAILKSSIINRDRERIDMLVKKGALLSWEDTKYVDSLGFTLVHIAAHFNFPVISTLLMHENIAINAKSYEDESTALHLAALRNSKECVEILLTYPKIEVSPIDKKRHTPLYYAAINGNSDIVNLLMKQKPKLTTQEAHEINEQGESLLHFAARHGYASLAKILVQDMLVDPNVITKETLETPLNLAVRGGHLATVEVLLTYSATIKTEIEDVYMKTPHDYALEAAIHAKNYTIVDRLRLQYNTQPSSNRVAKLLI